MLGTACAKFTIGAKKQTRELLLRRWSIVQPDSTNIRPRSPQEQAMCRRDAKAVHIRGLSAVLALFLLLGSPATFAQDDQDPPALQEIEVGIPYAEQGLDRVEFEAWAGHAYLIRVDSSADDLAIEVFSGDIYLATLEQQQIGPTVVTTILEDTGDIRYRIEITHTGESNGPVTLSVTDLGADYVDNAARRQAWEHHAESMVHYWFTGNHDAGAELATTAAAAFRQLGDSLNEADSLLLRAMILTEKLHDLTTPAATLADIDRTLASSYQIYEALDDTGSMGDVRRFNALSNLNAGNYIKAREYYVESAEIYGRINDWSQGRYVELDQGVIENLMGNSLEAASKLEALKEEDAQRSPGESLANNQFQAALLDQLGMAHAVAGNIDEAKLAFSEAASLHNAAGDDHGRADSLIGTAGIYIKVGELENAEEFLVLASGAAVKSGNGRVRRTAETYAGNIDYWRGNHEAAIEHYKAALQETEGGDTVNAYRQTLLGRAYIALGRYDEASKHVQAALKVARETESPTTEAEAKYQLGEILLSQGDATQAIAVLEEALAIYEELLFTEQQADTLLSIAESHEYRAANSEQDAERRTEMARAIDMSNQSLDDVEQTINKTTAPDLRGHYAAKNRDFYRKNVSLKLQSSELDTANRQKYVDEALLTSERARARRTLDLINEASVDLYERIDPAVALKRAHLIDDLVRIESEYSMLVDSAQTNAELQSRVSASAAEIVRIKSELENIEIQVRQSDARFNAIAAPESLSIDDIKRHVDADTTVVQYFFDAPESYVWVIDDESVDVTYLADKETIEQAARAAISEIRTRDVSGNDVLARQAAAREVAALVVHPIEHLLVRKNIVVIVDGALNYLPFQLLTSSDNVQLLESHNVVMLPSFSVLAALRARPDRPAPTRSVAIFADPIFSASDKRVTSRQISDSPPPSEKPQADSTSHFEETRSSRSDTLARLQGTKREAESIAGLVPAGDSLVLLDGDARKSNIIGENLADFRYLHFATHGMVDPDIPALSSLVFSRFNEQGGSMDGHLQLHDIYRLDVNAELVVLSACGTGLGQDVDGEGLVGLTQAFMYAGAKRMLVSLWDVPDGATAELMTRFYTQVLHHELPAPEALKLAQESMQEQRRWRDPYYWGAFVLMGDWQ
jgi:CHAT domain-containing protein